MLHRNHQSTSRIIHADLLFCLTFVLSHRNAVYKNPSASIEDRIKDLIPRMTLEEKVAQIIQGDLDGWMNMTDPLDNTLVHNRTGQSLFTVPRGGLTFPQA